MKGNDLSNRFSPIIAFKIEGFLLTPPKQKKIRLGLSKMLFNNDPFKHWELNNQAVKLINNIWRTTDYSINLYSINHPLSLESIKKKMNQVPHSHVFVAEDVIDLREQLDSQYTLYYFTNEAEELSVIGSMARRIDDLPKIVR